MSRITDILDRVRDSLADPDKTRWSDAQLLRVLSEAQRQFVIQTESLKVQYAVYFAPGVSEYSVPTDCLALIGVSKLAVITHEALIALDANWEMTTGIPTHVLVDKSNFSTFRVYPTPLGSASSLTLQGASVYGVITAITNHTTSGLFGVIGAIDATDVTHNVDPAVDGAYGFPVMVEDAATDTVLTYIKNPTALTAVTDVLETPEIWDTTLKHYVTGTTLRDDRDTQNRVVGAEELQLYTAGVQRAKQLTGLETTGFRTQYNTTYRTGFSNI